MFYHMLYLSIDNDDSGDNHNNSDNNHIYLFIVMKNITTPDDVDGWKDLFERIHSEF